MSDNGDGYDWSRAILFGPVVTETKINPIKGAKFMTISSPDGEGDITISITCSSATRAEQFLSPRDQASIAPAGDAPLLRRIKIIWMRWFVKIRLGTRRSGLKNSSGRLKLQRAGLPSDRRIRPQLPQARER